MTLLTAETVGRSYDDRVALDGVSVDVAEGQMCALIGHNGSGKSTFLRIVAGLLEANEGTVKVAGAAPGSVAARSATSYLGDTPVLYDDLTVRDHLEFVARLHAVDDWEEVAESLLETLDIVDRGDDLPRQLSRGLRQRAAAALAFVRPFRLVLIDEPFVGLDAPGRAALIQLVTSAARDNGAAVLLATHQLEMLRQVDRVIVLEEGRVVFDGKPKDVPPGVLADGLA